MSVPLLSQDEFFRHLELQSVHVVKYTYRQALKERLRATTKQGSLKPPSTKGAHKKLARSTSSLGSGDKPKEGSKSEALEYPRTPSQVASLVRNSPLYMHPRVKAELDGSSSDVDATDTTLCRDRSQIQVRKTYKSGCRHHCQTEHQISKQGKIRHSSRVRIQDKDPLSSEAFLNWEEKPPRNLVLWPDLTFKNDKGDLYCRLCRKRFISRLGLFYHVENGHRVCQVCRKVFHTLCPKTPSSPVSTTTSSTTTCERCLASRTKRDFRPPALGGTQPRPFANHLGLAHVHMKLASRKHRHHHLRVSNSQRPTPSVLPNGAAGKRRRAQDSHSLVYHSQIRISQRRTFKCDICSKIFSRRVKMIKHVMNQHSREIHQVDLGKFAYFNNRKKLSLLEIQT